MSQKRKMPSRKAIASFWNDELGYNNGNNCFACHWGGALERCHITARHNGGSDGVENLHVLCQACHDDSEAIEGKRILELPTLMHVRSIEYGATGLVNVLRHSMNTILQITAR
jgi:hypothetical protein